MLLGHNKINLSKKRRFLFNQIVYGEFKTSVLPFCHYLICYTHNNNINPVKEKEKEKCYKTTTTETIITENLNGWTDRRQCAGSLRCSRATSTPETITIQLNTVVCNMNSKTF